MRGQDHGTPFTITTSGTNSAVATQTGVAGKVSYITDVSCSSDLASAVMQVKQGTTVIWQERVGNSYPYEHSFGVPLIGVVGGDVSITINGTSACYANIAGYTLP